MEPIHALLNRIRWDRQFGAAHFAIGYFDRRAARVIVVPFETLHFEPGDRYAFDCVDMDGETHSVPLHRVRDVYRDGELVWHRQGHETERTVAARRHHPRRRGDR